MKNNRSSSFGILNWFLSVVLFAMILAFSLATAPHAQAAPSPAVIELSSTLMPDGSIFLAQIAPTPAVATPAAATTPTPAASPTAPVVASTPWYANAELWTGLFGFVAAVFGVVRNSQLSTHQKINQALVLGIEQATAIPAVAAFESTIKQTIQAKATAWGVQPILDRIVQDLTADKPAATTTTAPV